MSRPSGECRPQTALNVLFVIRYFHPFIGGLEKRVCNVAAALARRGIGVTIVTARLYAESPAFEQVQGFSLYRLPSPRIKIIGALVYLGHLVRFLCRTGKEYDAVHAFQVGYSSAVAIALGRLLGKLSVLHLSGGGRGGDVYRNLRTPWGLVFLALCRCSSKIVVLNGSMREELRAIRFPANKTLCVPNAVDADYYRPAQDRIRVRRSLALQAEQVVLYAGRLSAEKGLELLIRAFALVSGNTRAVLYIVGDGPACGRLTGLVHALQLDACVRFVPACEHVLAYYQSADIFVMPSLHEGLSNAVLEAMACELPVVATGVTGNDELVRHGVTGLLVASRDPAAMAVALEKLLADGELRSALGCRARRFVQTSHRYHDMIDQYRNMYLSAGIAVQR